MGTSKPVAKMSMPRYDAASVSVFGGSAFWITGGKLHQESLDFFDYFDETNYPDWAHFWTKTSEFLFVNGSVISGPTLPRYFYGHCMLNLDPGSDRILLIGVSIC